MFIRKVKTKSGAIAVQIAIREHGRDKVIKHLGSAHSQKQLNNLIKIAHLEITAGQTSLFDNLPTDNLDIRVIKTTSSFVYQKLSEVYDKFAFFDKFDEVFKQLVLVRIIEPSSKLDTIRILSELGLSPPSNTAIHRCLSRVVANDYRRQIANACFKHCQNLSPDHGLSLLLYDVTTLYFQVQKEDEFRKSGLSKERRLEPQIVVGLLVNRDGFPLEISEFEGNLAETKTMIPVIEEFCKKHQLDKTKITITADAGMLSASNLNTLEDCGLYFIVASRMAKTPYQIREYQKKHLEQELTDGQIFDTLQDFIKDNQKIKRRVIYQYKRKRAQLDLSNLNKQITKVQRVINGLAPLKKSKFLQIKQATKTLNQQLIIEHRLRAGIKGYVTNLPSSTVNLINGVPPQEVINAYHQLFQVEKSFRMSKSDLKARPIFHHKLDSIKAHLTIVFTALAIARYVESRTNLSIKKFVQTLRIIRTATLRINGKIQQAQPEIPTDVKKLVDNLN
jgi:hypothetical protein